MSNKLEQNEIIINQEAFLKAVAEILGKDSEDYRCVKSELGNKRILPRRDEFLISAKKLKDAETRAYDRGVIHGVACSFSSGPDKNENIRKITKELEGRDVDVMLNELQREYFNEVLESCKSNKKEYIIEGIVMLAARIIYPTGMADGIKLHLTSELENLKVLNSETVYQKINECYGYEFTKIQENKLSLTMLEFNKLLQMLPQSADAELVVSLERAEHLTVELIGKSKVLVKCPGETKNS